MKRGFVLADFNSFYLDNEYMIMSEIMENENLTQRELSKKLGISVSTVNVLMNKMIKNGLIKMTQVSQKQMLYILTLAGMVEKTKKIMKYLKYHYRVIYETKEKIKSFLVELHNKYSAIFIIAPDDEMGLIIGFAVDEFSVINNKSNINIIKKNELSSIKVSDSTVLLYIGEDQIQSIKGSVSKDLNVINLTNIL